MLSLSFLFTAQFTLLLLFQTHIAAILDQKPWLPLPHVCFHSLIGLPLGFIFRIKNKRSLTCHSHHGVLTVSETQALSAGRVICVCLTFSLTACALPAARWSSHTAGFSLAQVFAFVVSSLGCPGWFFPFSWVSFTKKKAFDYCKGICPVLFFLGSSSTPWNFLQFELCVCVLGWLVLYAHWNISSLVAGTTSTCLVRIFRIKIIGNYYWMTTRCLIWLDNSSLLNSASWRTYSVVNCISSLRRWIWKCPAFPRLCAFASALLCLEDCRFLRESVPCLSFLPSKPFLLLQLLWRSSASVLRWYFQDLFMFLKCYLFYTYFLQ